ncbi:Kelch repeat-containing protein 3 OS=Saccharomyces cerevisiae (strain ATCC 204508 / S288c) GN=KEL3 PE=1 SV=1 [Rhizoctonia solani AG-1 IB]|uniref:Kelch repeat-containing protein 3 n=3 Tax=Rhizoctonia solani TaxID=456999 RepID=A0A0B7FIC7_THACB|nr:Kelch repeat-containing protein 3 OS=Saccharomyces cerevisiae (strain ATCC 204508 / S288c) GN=KEL3 PE=1 SV=1 [Rhizoctonia solani AG-1 IB]
MAKAKAGKAAAKAAKKAKANEKQAKRETKTAKKTKGKEDPDDDLEAILEQMRQDWEKAHKVTEEISTGPPSRRANSTLTACPSGNYLWCIGGEYFSEDGKAHFYNDVYRYSPDKNEWRLYTSPTSPSPRSAHAVVPSPANGGQLFLFGGEFSSLNQTTFHHYRDFWVFSIETKSWERVETKTSPSARSGHRMAMWKHYILLFGGFNDPGIKTKYFDDLWMFDTQLYIWKQIEFGPTAKRPSARSGFSFIPTAEGVILHGGYVKEYVKGKRVEGKALEDTWLLQMNAEDPLKPKWEKRKKVGYAPTPRSGCTMALWATRSTGVMFGGVHDEDTSEETMDSVFYQDMYGYQMTGNGRWISLTLRKQKQKGKKPQITQKKLQKDGSDTDMDEPDQPQPVPKLATPGAPTEPEQTIPLPRYNALLAVLRNTLYIYGGIFERGSREYTLDDFYCLQLDKLDRFICLKPCDVVFAENDDSSSDDSDDSEGDSDTSDEEDEDYGSDDEEKKPVPKPKKEQRKEATPIETEDKPEPEKEPEVGEEEDAEVDELTKRAQVFLGVSKDTTRSAEETISTPLPGETLAMFYARSREYWAQKAHGNSDNRGKLLRRDGFALAEERYETYKPVLKEVEKILEEAGLDAEEIKLVGAGGGTSGGSRNRR